MQKLELNIPGLVIVTDVIFGQWLIVYSNSSGLRVWSRDWSWVILKLEWQLLYSFCCFASSRQRKLSSCSMCKIFRWHSTNKLIPGDRIYMFCIQYLSFCDDCIYFWYKYIIYIILWNHIPSAVTRVPDASRMISSGHLYV